MTGFEWFGNLFQSLTVLGVVIFILSYIAFLFTASIYLLRKGEDRYAWFLVGLVALFLGGGLSYGMAKSVELLAQGVRDSLMYVPEIQQSVNDAYNLGVSSWQNGVGSSEPTPIITQSDATIVATPGWPEGAQPTAPLPTSTPELPPTPDGNAGGGEPTPTLTNEQHATKLAEQQQDATFTPRPPTSTPPPPTYDPQTWNPATPPPTPVPGG